jgi:hypothetical protein
MNGDSKQPVQPETPTSEQPPQTTWQYTSNTAPKAANTPRTTPLTLDGEPVGLHSTDTEQATWSASEFIDHDKSFSWYAALAGSTLAIMIILFFWTHDAVSIIAIAAMAILLGIVAGRKPRVMDYQLDSDGLTIGERFHPYDEFRSFAIMEDGAFLSITFMPVKRFAPPVSIYYAPEDQEKITEVLSRHLPMEIRQHDMVDRFSRRIRF